MYVLSPLVNSRRDKLPGKLPHSLAGLISRMHTRKQPSKRPACLQKQQRHIGNDDREMTSLPAPSTKATMLLLLPILMEGYIPPTPGTRGRGVVQSHPGRCGSDRGLDKTKW